MIINDFNWIFPFLIIIISLASAILIAILINY